MGRMLGACEVARKEMGQKWYTSVLVDRRKNSEDIIEIRIHDTTSAL